MVVVGVLVEPPHASHGVRLWGQLELRLADEVDDLIVGQEVAGVEVDAPRPLPNDDLADGELAHDVLAVLHQALLNPPLVVVEDRPVGAQQAHHLRQALPLPRHVVIVGHGIAVVVIALLESGVGPLPAAPVLHAVAGAVLQVVRRAGHDDLDALGRHLAHDIQAIAAVYPPQPRGYPTVRYHRAPACHDAARLQEPHSQQPMNRAMPDAAMSVQK